MKKNKKETKKEQGVPEWMSFFYYFGLRKYKHYFVENFTSLLSSGLGVIESIESVREEIRSPRLRKTLLKIEEMTKNGSSVSKAFEAYHILPQHNLALIRAGELSGQLRENLAIVVLQNEKEDLFRSKLKSSVLYTGIIFTLSLVVAIGMAWFVLPKVTFFFQHLNSDVPTVTKIIIHVGEFFGQYGNIIVPVFVVFVLLILYFLFSFPRTRFIGHTILFNLPMLRSLIKNVEVARFGFLFGTMLSAGIPIVIALRSMASTTTFKNYKDFYVYLADEVEKGKSFRRIFVNDPKTKRLFPVAVRQMIVAGEQSGTLSDSLMKVGIIFERKTEATARNLPIILEPLLLVVIAATVAVIAFGILLPIYNLANVI